MRDSKPQAFPVGAPDGGYVRPGMTLRDYFAGQALAGLHASPHRHGAFIHKDDAEFCYKVADAMLEEREK